MDTPLANNPPPNTHTALILCTLRVPLLQMLTGYATGDLPGGFTLPDDSKLVVYDVGQWFNPCGWNGTCGVSFVLLSLVK